jgi:hypothetical protein
MRKPTRAGKGASIAAAPLLAALALFTTSCGGKAPEILAVEWRLEQRPSTAGAYESLSVFASIKDEDGIEDIEKLWVVEDSEELAWPMTSADWTKKTDGADEWIGAAGFARNDYAPIPRGEYRFLAYDAAGERIEKSFSVEGTFPALAAPELRVENGKISARSSWPETLVLAYDGTGALIASVPAPASPQSPEELFGEDLGGRTSEAAAYGYDPTLKMGAYSWQKKTR